MSPGRFASSPRNRTAHEYVLTTLRSAILGGTLKGGARLVQAELATELGVSTTPVREALRDLATQGLVSVDPHRGAVVRSLDIAEVREIHELRTTLEPLMIRRVIGHLTPDDLAHVEHLQRAMEREPGHAAWIDLNRGFHAALCRPADGSRLAGILAGLRDSAIPYVNLALGASPQHLHKANTDHHTLVGLYRAGDAEGAVRLTLQHIDATLVTIEKAHDDGLI
ncbi:GntR family transcriptional regulator [Microtetraspora sp. NBRC 13810]|uniref:GntR family transcriptional regulator n=1 Tax=Microtetraspora sp. NBRC 13810 TaxID=3030990 RepID=UPI00249FD4B2|nr:GntR family transcriptional regulator [Microtetraspora sp. NBRC 13810]GLW10727.1 GntR family transcriptional regulator [Microtetraspora sp. NBRC 13810]